MPPVRTGSCAAGRPYAESDGFPMPKSLLIVESPAKARTLRGYLGKDFRVGHPEATLRRRGR